MAQENKNLSKAIIQWSCECLTALGYTLKSNQPETVLSTPWSYVIRFDTTDGYIYLKCTPEQLALEPTIIQILSEQFNASVATVIAHNAELNCFLMKDAGRPLREMLKQQFDEALLCKAIEQFTSLQLTVADHIDVLLDIGVPDWRLDKLPGLYGALISQKDLLVGDGLSEDKISKLEALRSTVSTLCETLSNYAIKPTMVQPDFNDNNTLIDKTSQAITIIDLGEISISHPFFSLLTCLQQVKKHHGLTEKDAAYLRIKDACLRNYQCFFKTEEQLSDAFSVAQLLWIVYGILSHYRLMLACSKEKLVLFGHWKLGNSLKKFIAACAALEEF